MLGQELHDLDEVLRHDRVSSGLVLHAVDGLPVVRLKRKVHPLRGVADRHADELVGRALALVPALDANVLDLALEDVPDGDALPLTDGGIWPTSTR